MLLRTGGVVPRVAGLLHCENLESVTAAALERSECSMENVSTVAVTVGPGLAPCLKAGLTFAKELSHRYQWVVLIFIEVLLQSLWLQQATGARPSHGSSCAHAKDEDAVSHKN